MRHTFALIAVVFSAQSAIAAPDYLDDRSTPAALVRSLYNAISLHQYARAWSYYAVPEEDGDYADFARGYADTAEASVTVGPMTSEGAAGSIYTTLAVTVTARTRDGKTESFGGCYVVRQIQPGIQEPPFTPLQITDGYLVARSSDEAMPASCDADGRPRF
ncbi:hypothetical protein [Thioclava nitratireducens]|uniref:hypothetical protein n=1 Tax=Thioclava nitratireducens TaxID=1915078 RepID=UPI0024808796|nr:hypothetical protein [Thioclava nitratireducens]WGT48819.1 hypothetical protein P0N61_10825 [Thioclava nitratireducens]